MSGRPAVSASTLRSLRGTAGVVVAAALLGGCSLFGTPEAFTHTASLIAPKVPTIEPSLPEAGWDVASAGSVGVLADHKTVDVGGLQFSVSRFRSKVTGLNLHVGSEDPVTRPGQVPPGAGNSVDATELPVLVGVFNGGFKHPADLGGFFVRGVSIHPLVAGVASAVLYSDGSTEIGHWETSVPNPQKQVVSVRQNLPLLLVEHGQVNPAAATSGNWGATLGISPVVARSALGVDSSGNVVVADSMHATAATLARAMVSAGAVTAMETDINPYWVMLDTASHPGGTLVQRVPGQWHAPTVFLNGWTRDFFTVVARHQLVCLPTFGSGTAVNILRQSCNV
ncbi:MAG: phosphodiester glycosidase family protein [Actinomycetota bacterium]